jgi:hypothetical protein
MQFVQCLPVRGARPGCRLTTLFGNTAVPTVAAIASAAPKKRSWLPLLTVLFLISYGLMTWLIVEQGTTIESQRMLIRELFRDSTELSAVKIKAAREHAAASAKTQSPVTQDPSSQAPSTQVPSVQAPTKQAPSSQAGPQRRTQNQAEKQKQFRTPSKPAADLSDERRALITI